MAIFINEDSAKQMLLPLLLLLVMRRLVVGHSMADGVTSIMIDVTNCEAPTYARCCQT